MVRLQLVQLLEIADRQPPLLQSQLPDARQPGEPLGRPQGEIAGHHELAAEVQDPELGQAVPLQELEDVVVIEVGVKVALETEDLEVLGACN